MATLITSGGSTISPTIVMGYESSRESQSIIHVILGRANGSPDVTLRPALMRSGRLRLGFSGTGAEAAANTARNLLSGAAAFTLTSTELTTIPMTFVVKGNVENGLDDDTRAAWVVSFDYQETA